MVLDAGTQSLHRALSSRFDACMPLHGTTGAQCGMPAVVLGSLWQCELQLYDLSFVLLASVLMS